MLAEGLAGVLVNKVPAVRDNFVFMIPLIPHSPNATRVSPERYGL